MKKVIFFTLLLKIIPSISFAEELICQVKVNTQTVSEQKLTVPANASIPYAEVEGFRMKINNHGASKFELEIFDPSVPSRGYAEGSLKDAKDELKWTLWTRDILLETACRLNS